MPVADKTKVQKRKQDMGHDHSSVRGDLAAHEVENGYGLSPLPPQLSSSDMPVADKTKVQQRKQDMSHSSVRGDSSAVVQEVEICYGSSPLSPQRKKLSSTNLPSSPMRSKKPVPTTIRAPHSAPARTNRKLGGSMPGLASLARAPDLDCNSGKSPRCAKKKIISPKPSPALPSRRMNSSMPGGLDLKPPHSAGGRTSAKNHNSMPAHLNFVPNLFDDTSDDWFPPPKAGPQATAPPGSVNTPAPPPPASSPPPLAFSFSNDSGIPGVNNIDGGKESVNVTGSSPKSPMSPKRANRKSAAQGNMGLRSPTRPSSNSPKPRTRKSSARNSTHDSSHSSSKPPSNSPKPAANRKASASTHSPTPPTIRKISARNSTNSPKPPGYRKPSAARDSALGSSPSPPKPGNRKSTPEAPKSAPACVSRKVDGSAMMGGISFAPNLDDIDIDIDIDGNGRYKRVSKAHRSSTHNRSTPPSNSARAPQTSTMSEFAHGRRSPTMIMSPKPKERRDFGDSIIDIFDEFLEKIMPLSNSVQPRISTPPRNLGGSLPVGLNYAPDPRHSTQHGRSPKPGKKSLNLGSSLPAGLNYAPSLDELQRENEKASQKIRFSTNDGHRSSTHDTRSAAYTSKSQTHQSSRSSTMSNGKTLDHNNTSIDDSSRPSDERSVKPVKPQMSTLPSRAQKILNKIGIEKKPPKTLVIVWILVVAELSFDFVTTIISFRAFSERGDCCGHDMDLGPLPVGVTTPFFLLIMAELSFLMICMFLTMWPSVMQADANIVVQRRPMYQRMCCSCFEWNATMVLQMLNFTVILNPFFGCIIAWMLLYQSDKTESFIVLGLEGGTIVLHFLSVWLEGSCTTVRGFLFHCIQIIPFLTSVILVLIYLKQGGVCYLVEDGVFLFSGCEVCPDGYPPNDGVCHLTDGTNATLNIMDVWEVNGDFGDLADAFTYRSNQATYCAYDHPDRPQEDFCFFAY
jgi:hypothetical protein